MVQVFLETLVQMVRIFALIALGYFFAKKKIFPEAFSRVAPQIITKLLLPALSLYTFMTNCTRERLQGNLSLLLYGTVMIGLGILCAYLLSRKMARGDATFEGVLHYAFAFPNSGAFLTPIILATWGTEGYFYVSLVLLPTFLACYSWGIMQLIPSEQSAGMSAKEKRMDLLRRFLNPNLVAMLVGAVLGLCGADQWMPEIVTGTVKGFGDFYVLLCLIMIGFTIADYPLKDMLPNKTTFLFIGLRMIVMPLLLLVVMKLLRAPYYACFVAITTFACPCGMNVIVYPLAYGKDCKDACSLVLISSLLSIVIIPLMYSIVNAAL